MVCIQIQKGSCEEDNIRVPLPVFKIPSPQHNDVRAFIYLSRIEKTYECTDSGCQNRTKECEHYIPFKGLGLCI